jgi:hypothetical protein
MLGPRLPRKPSPDIVAGWRICGRAEAVDQLSFNLMGTQGAGR